MNLTSCTTACRTHQSPQHIVRSVCFCDALASSEDMPPTPFATHWPLFITRNVTEMSTGKAKKSCCIVFFSEHQNHLNHCISAKFSQHGKFPFWS